MPKSKTNLFEEKKDKKVVWIDPAMLGQIVDIDKPALSKKPEKANKLAEYDSSVKKEQVAPTVRSTPKKAVSPSKRILTEKEKNTAKPNPEEAPKETPKQPKDLSLKPQDLAKNFTKPEAPKLNSAPSLDFKSLDSGLAYGRTGTSSSQEFLPDYTLGGKTYLNAMKLQEISYFVKMKRILKLRWNPIPSVRNYLMNEKVKVNRIECVVGISLDPDGKTSHLFIIKGSGVGSYDREVLQTFKDSSPFSKPPEKYLKNGELNMSWTFTVYL
ncbi:MAG: TonB family protein [Deltaproteobacteria bacterium]|nr:TonB family protein [Deltaproteobacteria bacterium]